MILRAFIFLTVFIRYGLPANAEINERREMSISECAAKGGECDETRGRPVCGTDDQTYPTRCHLLRVQCSGHQVSLKYRGPCRAACKEAREYAMRHKSKRPTKFIPRCKAEGTYAAIQCLEDTGCWCSDASGKPIDNTTVRTGKPNCRQFKANKRRSPAHGPGRKRVCSQLDRALFNDNLISVFQSEYMRSGQQQQQLQQQNDNKNVNTTKSSDESVLNWKYAQLDINGNKILDKIEFRELKKLVKRAIKPKRCGRTLGKFCDIDADDRLTRMEWFGCITKDGINHLINEHGGEFGGQFDNNNKQHTDQQQHNRPSLVSNQQNPIHLHSIIHTDGNGNTNNHNKPKHHSLDELENESAANEDDESSQNLNNDYDEYEDGDDDERITNLNLKHETNISYLLRQPESPLKESESESDCLTDQANALEEQRQGGTIYYVPECTPDGRYQRIQCYRSTPYCWCVNEDTGKNIPGTSVKDKRPQCDTVLSLQPMKGCPEPRKTVFLKDLKEFLKTQLLSNANIGANATKWISEDERIATLSFVILDKNKNKALERKEWKAFRELMINTKSLRKCGKKMPRYCDVNSDKKITLSEWLNCLQTQRETETTQQTTQASNESVTNKPSRLIGSNPLEQYLKD